METPKPPEQGSSPSERLDSDSSTVQRAVLKPIAVILAILVLAGMAFVYAKSKPVARQYPEREQITFWHMWTAEWKKVIDDIVVRFNESQDQYECIALSVPNQNYANAKFLLSVAGDDPPDLMAQWSPIIPAWAEKSLLHPLDELMTEEELADFKNNAYPVVQRIGEYKGHIYGITTGINMWGCYYRPSHLIEAGLDPNDFPETMEELVEWGRKLTKYDENGKLQRIGFLPDRSVSHYFSYAQAFGGGFWDPEAEKLTIMTEENLAALEFMVSFREELGFDNVVKFTEGLAKAFTGTDVTGPEWPFIHDAYSIVYDGMWRVEQLADFAPEGFEYMTAALPAPEGGREHAGYANGNFMVIPVGEDVNAKGAWEFIKFWSGIENPERAAEFYTWGGWNPLKPQIAEAPVYQAYLEEYPQFRTFLNLMTSENVHPLPPVTYQEFFQNRMQSAVDAALTGALTPHEALENLQAEIDREVSRREAMGY